MNIRGTEINGVEKAVADYYKDETSNTIVYDYKTHTVECATIHWFDFFGVDERFNDSMRYEDIGELIEYENFKHHCRLKVSVEDIEFILEKLSEEVTL